MELEKYPEVTCHGLTVSFEPPLRAKHLAPDPDWLGLVVAAHVAAQTGMNGPLEYVEAEIAAALNVTSKDPDRSRRVEDVLGCLLPDRVITVQDSRAAS